MDGCILVYDVMNEIKMFGLLWGVVVVLFVLWLLGFLFHIAGGMIHILLVIAVIVVLYNLFFGSRSRGTLELKRECSERSRQEER